MLFPGLGTPAILGIVLDFLSNWASLSQRVWLLALALTKSSLSFCLGLAGCAVGNMAYSFFLRYLLPPYVSVFQVGSACKLSGGRTAP